MVPLNTGELARWTYSEVGGLDTSRFIEPELVHYPTFDAARRFPPWSTGRDAEGPYPVIISIHGGPESQSRPSFHSTIPDAG